MQSPACQRFLQNPSVDPSTGAPIAKGSDAYNRWMTRCQTPTIENLTELIKSNTPVTQDYRSGADIDTRNTPQWAPYYFFSSDQRKKDIKPILRELVNKKNSKGETPLVLAIANRNQEVIDLLIKAGADTSLIPQYVPPSVPVPVTRTRAEPMSRSRNPPIQDLTALIFLNEPLTAPAWKQFYDASTKIINPLLRETVNLKNDRGQTPLYLAARNLNMDIIDILLEAGANINATNSNGDTATHGAMWGAKERGLSREERLQFLSYLIDKGAKVCTPNNTGEDPLSYLIL